MITNLFDKDPIALDTESDKNGKLICISFAWYEGGKLVRTVYYVDDADWKYGCIQAESSRPKVCHNAKHDLVMLRDHGITVGGVIHDTLLMAKCVYELWPSYSLKNLGYYLLGDMHLEQIAMENWFLEHKQPRNGDMALLPRSIITPYTLKDVEVTIKLYNLLKEEILADDLLESYTREIQGIKPVMRMEDNLVWIDRPWVADFYKKGKHEQTTLRAKAKELAGDEDFNPNSIQQMAKLLAQEGYAVPLTAKGNPSLSKKNRAGINHPLIAVKDRLQTLSKETGAYCKNLLAATEKKLWIRPTFNQSLARTRRFSSGGLGDNLNFQNFPEEMRRAVKIPKGRVGWFYDYKGIENVIHIFLSDDQVRWQEYLADENWSEYISLSEKIVGEKVSKNDPRYKRIKSTKLGMNLGMGWKKFADYNGISRVEAKRTFEQIHRVCPAIRKLAREINEALAQYGFVTDPFGFRYNDQPHKRYKVVAYIIQGCAAALMKAAITEIDKIPDVKMHLTVHDELFFTTADDVFQWHRARLVKKAMTNFSDLFGGLPIRVETCRSTTNWADKKVVKV